MVRPLHWEGMTRRRWTRPSVLFIAALLGFLTATAHAAFGFDHVAELARSRAATPYVPPDKAMPT